MDHGFLIWPSPCKIGDKQGVKTMHFKKQFRRLACAGLAAALCLLWGCGPAVTPAGSDSEETAKTEDKKDQEAQGPAIYYSQSEVNVYADEEGKSRAAKNIPANEPFLVSKQETRDDESVWGYADQYGWVVIKDGHNELTKVDVSITANAGINGDISAKEEMDVYAYPNKNAESIGKLASGTVLSNTRAYKVLKQIWLKIHDDQEKEGWVLYSDGDKTEFSAVKKEDSAEKKQNESSQSVQSAQPNQTDQQSAAENADGDLYRTNDIMLVRSGIGFGADDIGTISVGQNVRISKIQTLSDGSIWGYAAGYGWVCMQDDEGSYFTKQ